MLMPGPWFKSRPLARSRQAMSFHSRAKGELERTGSTRGRYALDWTNFFLADVQTGFGTFVAFYLADLPGPKAMLGWLDPSSLSDWVYGARR